MNKDAARLRELDRLSVVYILPIVFPKPAAKPPPMRGGFLLLSIHPNIPLGYGLSTLFACVASCLQQMIT